MTNTATLLSNPLPGGSSQQSFSHTRFKTETLFKGYQVPSTRANSRWLHYLLEPDPKLLTRIP